MAKACPLRHRAETECGTFFSTFLPRLPQDWSFSDFEVPSLDLCRDPELPALSISHRGGQLSGGSGEAYLFRMLDSSVGSGSFDGDSDTSDPYRHRSV